jgi:hypothetical protein
MSELFREWAFSLLLAPGKRVSERRDPEERGKGGGGREVGKNSGLKGREG